MKILKHPAFLIGAAAIAGTVFGLIAGEWAGNLKVFGDIFIRLVQMSIVPLVMASVIVAIGSMSGSGVGTLAARTFGWMFAFAVAAAALATLLGAVLRPGAGISFEGGVDPALAGELPEPVGWQDTLLGFFSTNIFESMSTGNMVPVIIFALIFGLALNRHARSSESTLVLDTLAQAQGVILTMIRLVMYIAPIGVFCLLAALAGQVGAAVIASGLAYLGTTALGVIIMTLVFVLVTTVRTRLNPLKLPGKLAEQTVMAVTTTSSAVTFPTVLRTAVEKVGISPRVANFTLSVGLSMGSCGAVLNYVIVMMFLAQSGGVELSAGQLIMGMSLSILLNIGTVTVPGGFPVVAMFLATTMGLPIEALGLMIAVDWFTGILRTFLNVNGDTFVAMLVADADDDIDREIYNGAGRAATDEGIAAPVDPLPAPQAAARSAG